MKITVIDSGYQGLVVAACLAENGHQVHCLDADAPRIAALQEGRIPFHEPGLEELVARNREEERLHFTTNLPKAVENALIIMLCVPSPADEHGKTDIAPLLQAVAKIGTAMDGYRILVNKSACPPGTADEIERVLRQSTAHAFDVVVNPDFMKEGNAIDDFMRPDRVVIGCEDVRVREIMKELYSPHLRTGRPCLVMGRRSAEMTKYATNVMLASRISLMNQIADLCEALGADIAEVREGLSADARVGAAYLFPGIGFGGPGLPKDLAVCRELARTHGVNDDLFVAIGAVNERRRQQFLRRIVEFYPDGIRGKRLALWGAAYKPRTDDLRGAPAVFLIDGLLAQGAAINVYDPAAAQRLRERYGDRIAIAPKCYASLEGADGLIIVTEWNEFRRPDYERMAGLMRQKVIFDGRNLYTPAVLRQHGFQYFSVGRPSL